MIVEFGAMAKPISEQLHGMKEPEKADRAAQNITFLNIHGFLSDNEAKKARQRLLRMWEKGRL
jgi:hypothetical protein